MLFKRIIGQLFKTKRLKKNGYLLNCKDELLIHLLAILIRNNVGKMDVQIVQGYLGAAVVKE
jgi:hypothetical protein